MRPSRVLAALSVTLAAGAAIAYAAEEWSYEGETGPAHWGALSPDYAKCADGTAQSPIDLRPTRSRALVNIGFSYASRASVTAVDNGHTVEWRFAGGSPRMTLAGKRYELVQMHVHAPSEHKYRGRLYPAELHIVHRGADGVLAVVGFFVDRGAPNAAWSPLLRAMPAHEKSRKVGGRHGLRGLMPRDPRTIRYPGSLTTPPCSEGVRWNVMTAPITMSASQIATLSDSHPGNRRPLQQRHGRTLVRDSTRSR